MLWLTVNMLVFLILYLQKPLMFLLWRCTQETHDCTRSQHHSDRPPSSARCLFVKAVNVVKSFSGSIFSNHCLLLPTVGLVLHCQCGHFSICKPAYCSNKTIRPPSLWESVPPPPFFIYLTDTWVLRSVISSAQINQTIDKISIY